MKEKNDFLVKHGEHFNFCYLCFMRMETSGSEAESLTQDSWHCPLNCRNKAAALTHSRCHIYCRPRVHSLPVTPIVQRRCTPSWCGNKADALTLSTMSLFHSLCPLCRCFTHSVPYVAVSFTLSTMSLFHSLCPLCRCFTHSVPYVAVSLTLSIMSLFHSLSPLCRCFTLSTMSLFHSLCPLCHCFIHSVH